MDKFTPLGSHPAMSRYISSALSRPSNLPKPFAGASSLSGFKKAIENGRQFLPARYQKPYVEILNAALVQAEDALKQLSPRATAREQAVYAQLESVFTVLAAPIVQLSGSKYQKELKAFLALSSNLYRRFIDDDEVTAATNLKLLYPDLDPLAFFTPDQDGPYALAATRELPLTIIAKPIAQANCLPLWLADGHEVAGHGIHNHVEGLQDDLRAAIRKAVNKAFDSKKISTATESVSLPARGKTFFSGIFSGKKTLTTRDFMSEMFSAWVSEISADAAGLINMGPLFVDAGMLLFASSRASGGLSTSSEYDSQSGFSEYPMDLVRVLLTIEMVRKLPIKDAATYAAALHARLLSIMGGALPKSVAWYRDSGSLVLELPLSDLRAALPAVADAVLNSQLPALSNQSLTEVMTWTETDEQLVRSVSRQLERGDANVDIAVDARHIVSASLLAVERASTKTNFAKEAERIQSTGIQALADIYDSQCLLCLPAQKQEPSSEAATSLTDLVRMVRKVKNIRGR